MKTLNRAQRKMVIEHFANQCAEEMPADDRWETRYAHMDSYWLDLLKALGQVWRTPFDAGWYELIENMASAMQLDRDPAGHMNALGYADLSDEREAWKDHYDDIIGAGIDAISSRAH